VNTRPPALARWLLSRVLPADMRDNVPDELDELFARDAGARGRARASLGYWRQLFAFAVHLLSDRYRNSRLTVTPGISWIDIKLAVRMLARYPGLTVVGVLGMAVGIAIATAAFTIASKWLDPMLPLDEGDRVMAIQMWNVNTQNRELRARYDYETWRHEVRSMQEIGAFRTISRNLIAEGAQPENISIAEMTASGFTVARVAPLMGRYLTPEDERPGAADVLVIREDAWRRRFGADPGILRREVQLGGTYYTVVGVMPADFEFPLGHSYWIPLRLPPVGKPLEGPGLHVFGRLVPGATIESAQTELTAIGQRISAASPATHEHLRPRVMQYGYAFTDMDDPDTVLVIRAVQVAVVLMLIVVCVNVAILVYARTATRQGEIAVRAALGASRARIVAQLFAEALILSTVAALVGVGLVAVGFDQLETALGEISGGLPVWINFTLSPVFLVVLVTFTVLSAAIVGVIPALKATGRRVQGRLQGLSAGAGSHMQMGRLWSALIVAQVAIAVALLPATVFHSWSALRFRMGDPGYAAHEFLTAEVFADIPTDAARTPESERAFNTRYGVRVAELERALESEAAVRAVAVSAAPPGGELAMVLEAEGIDAPHDAVDYNIVEGSKRGRLVRFNRVAADFFDVFDVPLLMGRGLDRHSASIVVSRRFAEIVFGDGNPIGRRVRYVGRSREAGSASPPLGHWFEVAGVVADFPPDGAGDARADARVYHLAAPGDVHPVLLAVRVRGISPSSFTNRLREISAAVDPTLQLRRISSAEQVAKREQRLMRLLGGTLAAVMLSVVALSAAGIYSLMSFTVSRRRKEIGIRAALGADPSQILAGIFKRAVGQLAAGAALGLAVAGGLEYLSGGGLVEGRGAVILPMVAALMTTVGLLAAWGPARRGLRIHPTEALREE
jgi:putative ABC transport system permease protein